MKSSRYLRGNEESSNGSDSSDTEGERSSAGSTSIAWWGNVGWGGGVVCWWAVITRARSRLGIFWLWDISLGVLWVFVGLGVLWVFMSVGLCVLWVLNWVAVVGLGWAPSGGDSGSIAVVLSRADSGVDGGSVSWLCRFNWVFNWVVGWFWIIWSRIRVVAWWVVVGWGVIFFRNISVSWLGIRATASRVDGGSVDLGWAVHNVVFALGYSGVRVFGVDDWFPIWGMGLNWVDNMGWSIGWIIVDWLWLGGWLVIMLALALACLDGGVDLGLVVFNRGVVDGFVVFTCQSRADEKGRSGDGGEMHFDYITNIGILKGIKK